MLGSTKEFNPQPVRRDAIFLLVKEKGMVSVADLSKKFGVTTMTIRRDLQYLEQDGLIERIHGGAVVTKSGVREPLFTQKRLLHRAEKEVIAIAAAALVDDYDTIFLNSGTTTLRMLRRIVANHVKIVTNNAYFPVDDMPDNYEIISTGGTFRKESYTLIGDTALHTLSQVFASKAFIGVDGFDWENGMTTPVQSEAHVNRTMIAHTRGKVIVVADSSKIGAVSNFFVAPVVAAHMLITDSRITDMDRKRFEEAGIEVIVCEAH